MFRELYICNDMYLMEFFNNVFNIFYDKWISFGDDFYKMMIVLVIFIGMEMLIGII